MILNLTQVILGSHPDIYTRSEPWLMLYPAYRLKNEFSVIEYNSWLSHKAFQNFLSDLPNGRKAYLEMLQHMYNTLYFSYLEQYDKKIFLDKTPRYYLIAKELHEIFPDAKQILLLRNPLSVLKSIITSWTKANYDRLVEYKVDLYKAIEIFDDLLQQPLSWLHVIHYEALLEQPHEILQTLCNYIEIDYTENMLKYYEKPQEKWEFGDPKNIYIKKGIDGSNTNMSWLGEIEDSQLWRLFYDYLNFIGKARYNRLGYDYKKDMDLLLQGIPIKNIDVLIDSTRSLDSFLNPPKIQKEENMREMQLQLKKQNQIIKTLKEENTVISSSADSLYSELEEIKQSKKYQLVLKMAKLKKLLIGK